MNECCNPDCSRTTLYGVCIVCANDDYKPKTDGVVYGEIDTREQTF